MREQILAALSQYGSPALFAIVTIAAIGIPLPVTLLLIVTGSLVSQGVMDLWWAIGLAAAGSVIGDQAGYAIGRWGGAELAGRFSRLIGGYERLKKTQEQARNWGGPGIFFSRWLVTPLGPWVNLASGIAGYPWLRFLFWDTLGEFLGVSIYVTLGRTFSDRVLAMDALLGDLSWAIVALLAAVWLGWKLVRSVRPKAAPGS
jgi:membrane-associated protein